MLLITAANINNVLAVFGTRGILAGLLFIALGFVIGWLLGGPGTDTRPVLALGTALRNIGAALVVGSQSFDDPKVVVMVIVVTVVSLLIVVPLSRLLATRGQSVAMGSRGRTLDSARSAVDALCGRDEQVTVIARIGGDRQRESAN